MLNDLEALENATEEENCLGVRTESDMCDAPASSPGLAQSVREDLDEKSEMENIEYCESELKLFAFFVTL